VAAGTGGSGIAVAVKRFCKPDTEKLSPHRKIMAHIGKHVSDVQSIAHGSKPDTLALLDGHTELEAAIPGTYCIYQ